TTVGGALPPLTARGEARGERYRPSTGSPPNRRKNARRSVMLPPVPPTLLTRSVLTLGFVPRESRHEPHLSGAPMKRLATVLAVVALAACTKGGQSGSSSTTMQDTSHQMMMMSDTSKHMMADTAKHMMMDSSKMMKQPAPMTKKPARARTTKRPYRGRRHERCPGQRPGSSLVATTSG